MRKRDELTDPTSCLNRAREDELVFTILGRDAAAPAAIRAWVGERLRLGKNMAEDWQIRDALLCAAVMEREQAEAARDGTR